MLSFAVREKAPADSDWVRALLRNTGGDCVVSRGRKWFPADLPGFVAIDDANERVGLATYRIENRECELVTLDALKKWQGIGTALLERVAAAARQAGCRRLWLITTNDNIDAIRFYQRRGMHLVAVHVDALTRSRRLKPGIPAIGCYGIPIRDEIEFELML
ncbi:MAG: GNAT family N-acetyltransferase [Candidatus Zixiibacteriota bacterium]|nr:MAG: GNAT family N-acetyltransferase [candidate division Zixibacteria bacterium]